MPETPQSYLLGSINRILKEEIDKKIQEAAEEASEKIKKEIHTLTPRVLLGIQECMSVSWQEGPTMKIVIEFKNPKETK
jgi:hypothetical protein